MPVKYVPVDGVATYLHHRGATTLPGQPPDTSRGAVVLCVHDAGGTGNAFAGVLDALAAQGHSPLAYDQPGHGRSGSLDSLGHVAQMAVHLRALADALGLEHPLLLGSGMGAAVALEAAIADPAWPAALVLCDGPAARGAPSEETVERVRRVASGKGRREFDTSGYGPDTPREVYQRAFMDWLKTDPRALLGDLEALREWNVEGRLEGVACPVLVVSGRHEDDAERASAAALVRALPDGRAAELDGAGRHGVVEQPAGLAALVAGFLDEVVGRPAQGSPAVSA